MQRIVYICDECGTEYEADPGQDFKDAWEGAKGDGWRCYKDRDTDEWKHKCDECK